MRLLVLGGTVFLGRHLVEAALARNHEVTLFNRGQANPGHFPDVEQVHGDRDGGINVLRGRRWDAVIDTSGQLPRLVRASAELLADAVDHYTFVSSISVYADFSKPPTETTPLAMLADPTTEERTPENYGGHKALCEQAAEAAMPGHALVIRPGLIVGPYDPTDRFTYWPVRIDRGGEVFAPGDGSDPVQYIDQRDLGEWVVRLAEQGTTGVFNATGPARTEIMRQMVEGIRDAEHADAHFTWVAQAFLDKQNVSAWQDMPVWVPGTGDTAGFHRRSLARAHAAGLTYRPLADTARDTLAWFKTLPAERQAKLGAGLTAEREAALLASWKSSQSKLG